MAPLGLSFPFSPAERSAFWHTFPIYGAITAGTLLLFVAIIAVGKWDVVLLPHRVSAKLSFLGDGFVHRAGVRVALFFTAITCCAWLAALAAWGWALMSTVRPLLIGVAAVTIVPSLLLIAYGFLLWVKRGWRLTSMTGRSAVHVLFGVAGLLIVVFQLLVVFLSSYTYVGACLVFLGLNLLCMIEVAHAIEPIHPTLTVPVILYAMTMRRVNRTTSSSSASLLAEFNESLSATGDPSAMLTAKLLRGSAAYIMALLFLAGLAITHGVMSDHIALLGLADAITIACMDFASFLMHRNRLLRNPSHVVLVLAGCRLAVVAAGTSYWLLGFTAVYFVAGVVLGHLIVLQRFPTVQQVQTQDDEDEEADERAASASMYASSSSRGGLTTPSVGMSVASVRAPPTMCSRILDFAAAPEVVLGVLTLAFGILLLCVQLFAVPMPRIFMLERDHAQLEFGVTAVLAVAIYVFMYAIRRIYVRHGFKLDPVGALMSAICCIAVIVVGLVLKLLTGSSLLLAIASFGPPIVLLLSFMFSAWVSADFEIILTPPNILFDAIFCRRRIFPEPPPEPVPGAHHTHQPAPTGTNDSGRVVAHDSVIVTDEDGHTHHSGPTHAYDNDHTPPVDGVSSTGATPAPSATGRTGSTPPGSTEERDSHVPDGEDAEYNPFPHIIRDLSMLAGLVTLGLLLGFFSLVMWSTWNPSWVGALMGLVVAELILTAAPCYAYFQTLNMTTDEKVCMSLAILLHLFNHAVAFVNSPTISWVVFSFVLMPALIMTLCGLYQLKDNKWKWESTSVMLVGVSQILTVVIVALSMLVFDLLIGGIVFGSYVGLMFLVSFVLAWLAHERRLTKPWKVVGSLVVAILLLICAGMTVYSLISTDAGSMARAATWFSFSYLIVIVVALMAGTANIIKATEAGRMHYSVGLFPVYTYSGASDNFRMVNGGPLLVYFALLMIFIWGTFATCLVQPYIYGMIAMTIAMTASVLYVVDRSYDSKMDFATALRALRRSRDASRLQETLRFAISHSEEWLDELRNQTDRQKAITTVLGSSVLRNLNKHDRLMLSQVLLQRANDLAELEIDRLFGCGCMRWGQLLTDKKHAHRALAAPLESIAENGADPEDGGSRRLAKTMSGQTDFNESKADLASVRSGYSSFTAKKSVSRLAASPAVPPHELAGLCLESYAAVTDAFREEQLFLVRIREHVVEAGFREESLEASHWKAFLRWCAEPQQHRATKSLGLTELRYMHSRLQHAHRTRGVYRTAEDAMEEWEEKYGHRGAHTLMARMKRLMRRFDNYNDAKARANEDRRRADEAAVQQRQRERERQDEQRRERRLQQEAAARAAAEAAAAAKGTAGEETKAAEPVSGSVTITIGGQQYVPADDDEARALALVKQIEDSLAPGATYTDSTFLGHEALGAEDIAAKVDAVWARPSRFCLGTPVLQEDGFEPADIRQGLLGDCYLLSAMSVVAQRPGLLEKVFLTETYNPQGVYAVQFFRDGQWEAVVVDDQFPMQPDVFMDNEGELRAGQWDAHDNGVARHGAPAFAHSVNHRELWMMLIEKAYAKFIGSYAAMEGGHVHVAMVDLTGGSSEFFNLASEDTKHLIASGALWQKMLSYHTGGHIMAAGSPPGSDTEVSPMGIVQGHAYAILQVATVDDHRGSHQLVQLRNPWGHGEWTGAWSDNDTGNWTKRAQSLVKYSIGNTEKERDDGIFWMSFSDFVEQFTDLYVCRLFRTVQEGGIWHRYTAVGEWSGDTAAGATTNPTADRNPQFFVHPQAGSTVFVSLSQAMSSNLHPIGMYVLKKKGMRCKCRYGGETVATAKYSASREVTCEFQATDEAQPLTLFVSTFKPQQETKFRISVFSNKPLKSSGPNNTLVQIPDSVPAK